MIEEATVDAHNETEQRVGFYTMLEEHLELPFESTVLGVHAIVERIHIGPDEEIAAICRRGRFRQVLPLLSLPLRKPRPKGAEWVEAYRRWAPGTARSRPK